MKLQNVLLDVSLTDRLTRLNEGQLTASWGDSAMDIWTHLVTYRTLPIAMFPLYNQLGPIGLYTTDKFWWNFRTNCFSSQNISGQNKNFRNFRTMQSCIPKLCIKQLINQFQVHNFK